MAFVLIGFMGAGKSTVAAELASALGTRAVDSDELLERDLGHQIAHEFELNGEDAFRAREEQLVCDLLAGAGEGEVIALGGGSVLSGRVREALEGHVTVLLDVEPGTAWERVSAQHGGAERPLASDRERFDRLHAQRRAVYEQLADAVLPALELGAGAGALRSLRSLASAPAGTRLLWASAASGDYPVFVGRGLLSEVVLGDVWPLDREISRPFGVSDANVAEEYGARLALGEWCATIAAGETNKTLASAEAVWKCMLDQGVTRADHVVALGGGVVGDLAGFCAATYQRGLPVVQVPTTLVAQVDSAFGGKTGVDLPDAKNYVGVYHQPAGVIVDPDALETLPREEYAAGWVEVLKTALIAGGELWDSVAGGGEVDERTIVACIRTKLAVVAADERDGSRRQVLNLGHTVGHAIETTTKYGRFRHGEAVGIGLLAALRLSGRDDLRLHVHGLLTDRGLPVSAEGLSAQEIVTAIGRDKKRTGARVPFVLLAEPGDVSPGHEVSDEDLMAAVEELVA